MARTAASTPRYGGYGINFAGGASTDNVLFAMLNNTVDQAQKSCAFWAKFISAGGGPAGNVLVFPGAKAVVRFNSTAGFGYIQTFTGNGIWSITATALLGSWHHYAVTYDRSGGTPLASVPIIYVDGAVATITATTTPTGTVVADNGKNYIIGNNATTGGIRAVDGTIANMFAYNRILSSAEVLALYQGTDPSSTSLALKARFVEGSGIVSRDEGPNNMKSTFLGTTWVTTPTVPLMRVAASARAAASSRTAA